MNMFSGDEFIPCKEWIADQIKDGFTWNDVLHFCVSPEKEIEVFNDLKDEQLIIPPNMEYDQWGDFIDFVKQGYTQITSLYGISAGEANNLRVPVDEGSPWISYKNHLLGKYTGKPKMSDAAVTMLENNCHWILNHMRRDTREAGPVKGLVMGSVQSGKTANMIGLVTMAAHYDWNIFIILSGSIDNLRKQTRDRFFSDLSNSPGVSWHVMDYTSNPDYMLDVGEQKKYLADDLKLNTYQEGAKTGNWLHRYVFVCLKNSTRLKNLIYWLHSQESKASKMRILIIDDEADQASVNTVKMGMVADEEEIERTAVNQLIIDLVRGCDSEGNKYSKQFQAMNYISFTATPYANVLNEAYRESLYPSNFICSLPESKEYFGPKAIWGSKYDDKYNGINIVRTVPSAEMNALKLLHKGNATTLPEEFQKSIAWFLCSAAILRYKEHKKPISMLIHTTAIQNGHFEEYDVLRNWLLTETKNGNLFALCARVYEEEKDQFRLDDLKDGFPEYAAMDSVEDDFPEYSILKEEIANLLSQIVNIELGEDKAFVYHEDAIHLCVDNCRANREAEEGTFLRIVYPNSETLSSMKKAPVFIVMGGNTLSRGLTLEGLVCTYFARNVNQADTLMQMARWFGYRKGYELLQRIWMPVSVQEKFELIETIDERLKLEFEDYMIKGKSPATFGPRIMNSSEIARFKLTATNKSQNMVACDIDFSGDSYEVTKFEKNEDVLKKNIASTEDFLSKLGTAEKSDAVESAYVWRNIDAKTVINDFLTSYSFMEGTPLYNEIPIFIEWMSQMNDDGKYLRWNVAVAGDKKADERWIIAGADVGKIERSKKKKTDSPNLIDIGSLRSGRDILSDISVRSLSDDKANVFKNAKTRGTGLISFRYEMGLGDVPLLLIYRIDHNKGNVSKYREQIGTDNDIIGFSIVVSGESASNDYVKTVHVRNPE